MSALVADHLCTSEPARSQQWYSENRNHYLQRERIAGLLSAREGEPPPAQHEWKRITDRFERTVARAFLDEGWACGAGVLSALGLLGHDG